MLTDEQLLQSQAVRDVLARMGNQGLHKTAGAVALGVDEVTLENAVLAICTKIAAQVLKEQRIASGLASLAKTAMTPAQQAVLGVGALGAGIGGYNAYQGARDANPSGDPLLDRVGPTVAGGVGGAVALPVGAVTGGALGLTAGRALEGLGSMVLPQRYARHLDGAAPLLGFAGAVDGGLGGAKYVGREIGEKTAASLANIFSRGKTPIPHTAPPRPPADVIAPVGGGDLRLTGAGDKPVPNKVPLPEWLRNQQAAELPKMRTGVERMSAPSSAPKAKSRPTEVFDPQTLELNRAIAGEARGVPQLGAQPLDASAFGASGLSARGGRMVTAAVLDRIFYA